MSNNIENDVFNKYLEIKQDLVNNLNTIFNRQHYYTHKYRGNILTDINVSLDFGPNNDKIIQVFVRHKNKWIRDVLTIRTNGEYYSEVKTNIYD